MHHEVWALERFQTAKMTVKVIQGHWELYHSVWATYYIILVFHCNYVSILHRF